MIARNNPHVAALSRRRFLERQNKHKRPQLLPFAPGAGVVSSLCHRIGRLSPPAQFDGVYSLSDCVTQEEFGRFGSTPNPAEFQPPLLPVTNARKPEP